MVILLYETKSIDSKAAFTLLYLDNRSDLSLPHNIFLYYHKKSAKNGPMQSRTEVVGFLLKTIFSRGTFNKGK